MLRAALVSVFSYSHRSVLQSQAKASIQGAESAKCVPGAHRVPGIKSARCPEFEGSDCYKSLMRACSRERIWELLLRFGRSGAEPLPSSWSGSTVSTSAPEGAPHKSNAGSEGAAQGSTTTHIVVISCTLACRQCIMRTRHHDRLTQGPALTVTRVTVRDSASQKSLTPWTSWSTCQRDPELCCLIAYITTNETNKQCKSFVLTLLGRPCGPNAPPDSAWLSPPAARCDFIALCSEAAWGPHGFVGSWSRPLTSTRRWLVSVLPW